MSRIASKANDYYPPFPINVTIAKLQILARAAQIFVMNKICAIIHDRGYIEKGH